MTDTKKWTGKEKEALLAEMAKTRAHRLPVYDYLLEKIPDFMGAVEHLYSVAMGRPGRFPQKMRELFIVLTMSAEAYNPREVPALKNHIRHALKLGLTEEEMLEAMMCCVGAGSMKNFMLAATLMMEVVNEPRDERTKA